MTAVDPNAPWASRPQHIQDWIDERSGKHHAYFRKKGARRVPLKAPWGTQAMADEVAELLKTAGKVDPPTPQIGTLAQAVRAYRGDSSRGVETSAAYLNLSPATQARYDVWLDRFEAAGEKLLLEDITPAFVLEAQDRWAKRGHQSANTALQVMKQACKRPIILGLIPVDPFTQIDNVARPKGLGIRNPRWEDVEVEAVLEYFLQRKQPHPGFARGIALGRWGGFRKQSICRITLRARIQRPNEDGAFERRLHWLTEKKEVLCDRREDPRLTKILADTPNRALTIAYNSQGQRWQPRAFSHVLDRALATLAKQGEVRETLTTHGLRHARGVELAYAGGSDAEIMSQIDHATPKAAQGYRAQADRLRLADQAQNRVDAEVERLDAARKKRRHQPEG